MYNQCEKKKINDKNKIKKLIINCICLKNIIINSNIVSAMIILGWVNWFGIFFLIGKRGFGFLFLGGKNGGSRATKSFLF